MATLGSRKYRVGLIVARCQPFHNGHLRAITDALMMCDEVIFSVRDYNTSYFDYNIAQKSFRLLYNMVDRISFFGTMTDSLVVSPKQIIRRTLDDLQEANYHLPTHFFTNSDYWVEPAKELMLETIKIQTLALHDSDTIRQSVVNGTDFWKEKVPYSILDGLETYIATKNRLALERNK